MIKTFSSLPMVLVSAALLAGCSLPRVAPNTERGTYLAELYRYGAGDRDLALEVRGNPFAAADKPMLDAMVEKAVGHAGILQPPTRPRLSPDASAVSNYRMIVEFSPNNGVVGQDLCDGAKVAPFASPGDKPGEVAVVMAFCVSGRAASQAQGWYSPNGIDDPDLSGLLKRMEVELFRPDDTLQGSGDPT
ncbi:MAG TPA: hypothetical protein VM661_16115 [Candidatus Sulfotelmatobacter sp.]|jgi:hypothetical protein|nr:hypothetical protein [Candidatus Sulfotelmatobacter sp.]